MWNRQNDRHFCPRRSISPSSAGERPGRLFDCRSPAAAQLRHCRLDIWPLRQKCCLLALSIAVAVTGVEYVNLLNMNSLAANRARARLGGRPGPPLATQRHVAPDRFLIHHYQFFRLPSLPTTHFLSAYLSPTVLGHEPRLAEQ